MSVKKVFIKVLPVAIVAAGILTLLPLAGIYTKVAMIGVRGLPIWTEDFKRIDEFRDSVSSLIRPTGINKGRIVYSSAQYQAFRYLYGKPENWLNEMSAGGETFRERIEKQIRDESRAVSNLVSAIKLVSTTTKTNRGNYKVTDYVINQANLLKFNSEYLSEELAIIAADPLQAAIAFHRGRFFNGVLPANYIYNSYGSKSLEYELNYTSKYLLQYDEFWFKFIFIDDFFKGSVNKIRKQREQFKYIDL